MSEQVFGPQENNERAAVGRFCSQAYLAAECPPVDLIPGMCGDFHHSTMERGVCASKAWQAAQASCQLGLIGCWPGLSGVFRGESECN